MRIVRLIAVCLLAASASASAFAQGPDARWRTVTTPHFRIHYPVPYEEWTMRAATRLESIRDAVVTEVGFAPEQRTDVLVMNPVADPNGITLPLLDTPRIVLYTEAAGPELEIGDYTDWIDLLAVHEVTHLVHLLRPSRNAMQRLLARLLPLDPITLHAPRWVLEGYATVVEGRLTGSGRPSSAVRAAILRRWAQAGRLPSYGQLPANQSFLGMSMAYLAGSAYLEWLEERSGPGSLRKLWARMTARQQRTFEQSFEGVFGDRPDRLYGRFVAELTERALTIERTTGGADREGQLWQETVRNAGDPDVSPDGRQLALVLRPLNKPARIVVLSTEPSTVDETKFSERIAWILQRDPEDVAPVRARPLPRKPLRTFTAPDGGDLSTPRWTADGRSLIYSHRQPDRNGFLHRDLFRWKPEDGTNQRITRFADVSDADPFPDGGIAAAVRNRFGFSQVVKVDLSSGEIAPITEASLDVVYSHPRVSADGRRIAFTAHRDAAWNLTVRDLATGEERVMGGGARTNAIMPEWSRVNREDLYATVMARGFVDPHRFRPDGSHVPVTRTEGAALGVAPSSDGRLFFMSLEPDGFVVRTLDGAAPPAAPRSTVDRDFTPAVPNEPARTFSFPAGSLSAARPYGIGRQEPYWIAGGTYAAGPRATEVGLRLGDVAGRLDTIAIGALGSGRSPHGFALASAWRGWPVTLAAQAYSARGLDAPERGLELRASREAVFPRSGVSIDAGILGGPLRRAFGGAGVHTRQLLGSAHVEEALSVAVDGGGGASHVRGIVRGTFTLGALRIGGRYQRDSASGVSGPLEQLGLGGVATSIAPLSALATRILDPALEPRTLLGTRYEGRRSEVGYGAIIAFWQEHRLDGRRISLAGVEYVIRTIPMPIVKAPAMDMTVGVARLLDQRRTRAWLAIRWKP